MRVVWGLTALALTVAVGATEPDQERVFDPAGILEWSSVEFEGRTEYRLQSAEQAGADHAAVRADCTAASASGRILEQAIDLTATPILEWRWRVDSIYTGLDERSKAGDDYPARVYVVAQRWPRWRSRAINYVWSSGQPIMSDWPNAFAGQFRMLALRSGADGLGEWQTERRDLRADFRALHGIELEQIDALAIMTDCDNAGQSATAWYGPIRLSAP